MYGSFLSLAHRETVLVDTCSTRATSAVRKVLVVAADGGSYLCHRFFLCLKQPWSRRKPRDPFRLNVRPFSWGEIMDR